MKNIGAEVAESIVRHFESDTIKKLIDDTKAAPDSDTGTFEVIITTENLDRYQEVIKLDGWELEHYRKNPVVLWGHNHNDPIGMATSVEIIDGKMVAKGKFAPTERAQEIRKLYDFGIIRATSVGFIEKQREGNLITKAELLEFSFVSVPANPYALSLAMEKELSLDGLVTKGFMHVEKSDAAEVVENEEAVDDAPITETASEEQLGAKGAIADEAEAQAAREKKWKNFSAVDDVMCSFWKVYFDSETPVQDFTKLLDETIELLKQINGSEKAAPTGIIPVVPSAGRYVALEALGIKSEEPEGDEAAIEGDETEDERKYREFNEMRKFLQDFSTLTSDVLADARKAVEAKKAAHFRA